MGHPGGSYTYAVVGVQIKPYCVIALPTEDHTRPPGSKDREKSRVAPIAEELFEAKNTNLPLVFTRS